MYWTFILLLCLSATFGNQNFIYQTNYKIDISSIFSRFLSAVIFGDSASDTGNVYQLTDHTWPITPPYYKGQFCNGPNWAYDLNVFVKYNYAYGSATTDNNLVPGLTKLNTVPVPGILQQVQQYISNPPDFLALLTNVHIIWGGANDIIFKPALIETPLVIVQSLMNSTIALLKAGAKNIVFFNQEPFQDDPYVRAENQPVLFTEVTIASNNAINASLQALQAAYPEASIYLFDLHSLITDLLANPPPPITNTTGYCWDDDHSFTHVIMYCSNPNTFFFLDNFHFTSPVQQKLAEAVHKFFKFGFIPNSPTGRYFYSYK
jgi:phospholipase/lecithinase/hemolysin